MRTTKIKSDFRGLYVQAGGHIFRPVKSTSSYPVRGLIDEDNTSFNVGDEVSALQISQTPFGRLKMDNIEELWSSHGTIYGLAGNKMPTMTVWSPVVLEEHGI